MIRSKFKPILIMFWGVLSLNCEFVYEPETKVIVVTGVAPRDGHLRLIRSANARNLRPVLLRVENGTEVEAIRNYLRELPLQPNEISVITSSSDSVCTGHASSLSLNVARVALTRDGDVVMASIPDPEFSRLPTSIDEQTNKQLDLADAYIMKHFRSDSEPDKAEEWRQLASLNAKYMNLVVKQKRLQAKAASVYDHRHCAFAGLTEALKSTFEKIYAYSHLSSRAHMSELCAILSDDVRLRNDLRIVKDLSSHVFKRSPSSLEEGALDIDSLSKTRANNVWSSNYDFSPMTFGSSDILPFSLANLASGDVVIRPPDRDDFLDLPIANIKDHFQGELPEIHIVVVKTAATRDPIEFLQHLSLLSYPRNKLKIDILVQLLNEKETKNISKIMEAFEKIFPDVASMSTVPIPTPNVQVIYERAGKLMKKETAKYSFLLHASVHFTDSTVIEELLKYNRRVVSPLLETAALESNFKSERIGSTLGDNFLTQVYETQQEESTPGGVSMVGLLQVPYVFGAILLRQDVVHEMVFAFDLCPATCPERDPNCRKQRDGSQCEPNVYENLGTADERFWGAMCKSLVEGGYIIHVSNENVYGDVEALVMTDEDRTSLFSDDAISKVQTRKQK